MPPPRRSRRSCPQRSDPSRCASLESTPRTSRRNLHQVHSRHSPRDDHCTAESVLLCAALLTRVTDLLAEKSNGGHSASPRRALGYTTARAALTALASEDRTVELAL